MSNVRLRMRGAFESPTTVIHASICDNDIPLLRQLLMLSTKTDVCYSKSPRGTPFHVAAWCNNLAAVDLLLDAGADPLAVEADDRPTSPLMVAAMNGHGGVLRRLWAHVSPERHANGPRPYLSCLVKAAAYGQASTVGDLLNWWDGWSSDVQYVALRYAVGRWEPDVVDRLLSKFTYSQHNLTKALHWAADEKIRIDYESHSSETYGGNDYLRQQQLIARLIDAGADPNDSSAGQHLTLKTAVVVSFVGALRTLLEKCSEAKAVDSNGKSALHILGCPVSVSRHDAADTPKQLREEGIRLLLKYGASIYHTDQDDNTPIHYAAYGSDMRILRLYIPESIDRDSHDAICAMKNKHGETLLHWAAAGGKIDILVYLLSRGAAVNETTENGWTPIMCALVPCKGAGKQAGDALRAAGLLLLHGADPLSSTPDGLTALHCLALHTDDEQTTGAAKLAEELVMRGASVEARAPMLVSSWRSSLSQGHPEAPVANYSYPWGFRAQKMMALAGSQPEMVKLGLAPLHWAAHHGALGVTKVLLAHGANPSAEDALGDTPARVALQSTALLVNRRQIQENLIHLLVSAGGGI